MSEQLSMYFNTTGLQGGELLEVKERIGGQNKLILDFFKRFNAGNYTPFEVQQSLSVTAGREIPITSIRRAMNTLTELGYLVKTDKMKPGAYGSMNHTWKYNG